MYLEGASIMNIIFGQESTVKKQHSILKKIVLLFIVALVALTFMELGPQFRLNGTKQDSSSYFEVVMLGKISVATNQLASLGDEGGHCCLFVSSVYMTRLSMEENLYF